MSNHRNRHIPDKNYKHDCGHEFYYRREERENLPNAVKSRKPAGMRRFVILFFDLILVVGGVTVIRTCLVGKKKEPLHSLASKNSVVIRDYAATTTVEKRNGVREYRLTIRKKDRTLFAINTNRFSVKLSLKLNGQPVLLGARTLAPEEKLISHQFFITIANDKNPSAEAVFLWQVAANRVVSISSRTK